MKPPRISIVTASFNQGRYIRETIESVLAQGYPELEHIVVDGMSSDDTPAILAACRHLKVIREPDRGQADAINKGFRIATGEILGFLNSDDTLLPGALDRVAAEIDPTRGRHVVMGRCPFVDEKGCFLGVEHPSAFESHTRVLQVWKGHCIPQPAVFFSREAWERSGPMDVAEPLVPDYDLFCRMSRSYRFHVVDQAFATYRLHEGSKTRSVDDQRRLLEAVRVSRRYWGPWHRPGRWRLEGSWLACRVDRRGRAVRWLQSAREAWHQRRVVGSMSLALAGALSGPDVFLDTLLMPALRSASGGLQGRVRPLRLWRASDRPETMGWRDFRGLHADGWAGPELVTTLNAGSDDRELVLKGTGHSRCPARLDVSVDGVPRAGQRLSRRAAFELRIPMEELAPGPHEIRVTSSSWYVPHDFVHNRDFRPLAFQVTRLAFGPGGH